MVDRHPRGFTLTEVVVALAIIEVGLLGLVASTAFLARLVAQGRRAEVVAAFATHRLEGLFALACTAMPSDGTEELRWGGTIVATNHWTVTADPVPSAAVRIVRIRVSTSFVTGAGSSRTIPTESAAIC